MPEFSGRRILYLHLFQRENRSFRILVYSLPRYGNVGRWSSKILIFCQFFFNLQVLQFQEIMSDKDHKQVFIITGQTGSGKTTFLLKLIEELRKKALSIVGFAAMSVPEDGPSGSFNILDLLSGKILPLASRRFSEGWELVGNFYFNPEGMLMGKRILEDPLINRNDLIIVDEIGPFELEGNIWAESLTSLLAMRSCSVLLVVRDQLVAEVIHEWSIQDAMIIDIGQSNPGQAAMLILSQSLKSGN